MPSLELPQRIDRSSPAVPAARTFDSVVTTVPVDALMVQPGVTSTPAGAAAAAESFGSLAARQGAPRILAVSRPAFAQSRLMPWANRATVAEAVPVESPASHGLPQVSTVPRVGVRAPIAPVMADLQYLQYDATVNPSSYQSPANLLYQSWAQQGQQPLPGASLPSQLQPSSLPATAAQRPAGRMVSVTGTGDPMVSSEGEGDDVSLTQNMILSASQRAAVQAAHDRYRTRCRGVWSQVKYAFGLSQQAYAYDTLVHVIACIKAKRAQVARLEGLLARHGKLPAANNPSAGTKAPATAQQSRAARFKPPPRVKSEPGARPDPMVKGELPTRPNSESVSMETDTPAAAAAAPPRAALSGPDWSALKSRLTVERDTVAKLSSSDAVVQPLTGQAFISWCLQRGQVPFALVENTADLPVVYSSAQYLAGCGLSTSVTLSNVPAGVHPAAAAGAISGGQSTEAMAITSDTSDPSQPTRRLTRNQLKRQKQRERSTSLALSDCSTSSGDMTPIQQPARITSLRHVLRQSDIEAIRSRLDNGASVCVELPVSTALDGTECTTAAAVTTASQRAATVGPNVERTHLCMSQTTTEESLFDASASTGLSLARSRSSCSGMLNAQSTAAQLSPSSSSAAALQPPSASMSTQGFASDLDRLSFGSSAASAQLMRQLSGRTDEESASAVRPAGPLVTSEMKEKPLEPQRSDPMQISSQPSRDTAPCARVIVLAPLTGAGDHPSQPYAAAALWPASDSSSQARLLLSFDTLGGWSNFTTADAAVQGAGAAAQWLQSRPSPLQPAMLSPSGQQSTPKGTS